MSQDGLSIRLVRVVGPP